MDDYIAISWLNDFIFCPASIYFHQLYGEKDKMLVQTQYQIEGTQSHEKVDEGKYSTRKTVLQAIFVSSDKYRLVGRIDTFDTVTGILTERKNKIAAIYDGYVFQLYAQYFALQEMGYTVKRLRFHSLSDNKNYEVALPEDNPEMLSKFEKTVDGIRNLSLDTFVQTNSRKCQNCIYEPACDRTLI